MGELDKGVQELFAPTNRETKKISHKPLADLHTLSLLQSDWLCHFHQDLFRMLFSSPLPSLKSLALGTRTRPVMRYGGYQHQTQLFLDPVLLQATNLQTLTFHSLGLSFSLSAQQQQQLKPQHLECKNVVLSNRSSLLEHVTSLKSLVLENTTMSDPSLQQLIQNNTQLQHLSLRLMEFSVGGVIKIFRFCPNLSQVTLETSGDAHPKLVTTYIRSSIIPWLNDIDWGRVVTCSMRHLTHLHLQNCAWPFKLSLARLTMVCGLTSSLFALLSPLCSVSSLWSLSGSLLFSSFHFNFSRPVIPYQTWSHVTHLVLADLDLSVEIVNDVLANLPKLESVVIRIPKIDEGMLYTPHAATLTRLHIILPYFTVMKFLNFARNFSHLKALKITEPKYVLTLSRFLTLWF